MASEVGDVGLVSPTYDATMLCQSRPFHRAKREDKLFAAIACTTASGSRENM